MKKETKWIGLDEFIKEGEVNKEKIPGKPGVYLVRWSDRSEPMQRLLEDDQKKIMYIGESGDLRRRIGHDFLPPYYNKTHGPHPVIITLYNAGLMEKIPFKELEVTWICFESKDIAEGQEFKSLKLYELIYGELPPLNKGLEREKVSKEEIEHSIDESLEKLIK